MGGDVTSTGSDAIRISSPRLRYYPILLEHGADATIQNAHGQTVIHLLAERAVRSEQQRSAIRASPPPDGNGAGGGRAAEISALPASRMLQMLAEAAGGSLPLDAAENESGNTATHIAAFGGCIELAQQLVCLGASVGLPNRDGFTPLDSMQASLPALGLSPRPSSPSSAILSLSLLSLSPPFPLPPPPAFLRCPPLRRAATRRGRSRCYSSRRSRSLRRGRPTGWCRPASSASYRSTAPTRAWLASTIAATADAACARSARRAAPRSRSSARHKRNACASSASAPFPKTQAKAPECGFVNLDTNSSH